MINYNMIISAIVAIAICSSSYKAHAEAGLEFVKYYQSYYITNAELVKPNEAESISDFMKRTLSKKKVSSTMNSDGVSNKNESVFFEMRVSDMYGSMDSSIDETVYISFSGLTGNTSEYNLPSDNVRLLYYERIHSTVNYGYGAHGVVRINKTTDNKVYIHANVELIMFTNRDPNEYYIEYPQECNNGNYVYINRKVSIIGYEEVFRKNGSVSRIDKDIMLHDIDTLIRQHGNILDCQTVQ